MPLTVALTGRVVIIVFIIIAVVSFGLLAYIGLPKATIEISPASEIKSVSQQIIISSNIKDPDFVHYKLPAKIIEKEISDKLVVERAADATFDDFARGKVTLLNKQEEEQQLLPQTHLRHVDSGVLFLTDTGIAIPPGGDIGITVTAKTKGSSGNVGSGAWIVEKLPSYLQDKVYGISNQPFSGGIAVEKPLTEKEVEAAREQLLNTMEEQLRGVLTAAVGGASIREDLLSFDRSPIDTSVPIGSKASVFEVAGKIVGRAFIIDENDLLGLTLLNLRSAASPEQEFIKYDPRTFTTTMIKRDVERGEAIVEGSLSGTFATKIGPTVFTGENLAGLSADEVREKLIQLPGVGEVNVIFSPFWVTTVPSQLKAIEIVVKK